MFKITRCISRTTNGRNFHASCVKRIDVRDVEEVKIPVPWGHIAGKWWGDQKTRPVLAAHGLLDNAGSFDRLIPKLDLQSVLCLDLPGHGFSSHLPMPGKFLDYVFLIRFLIKNHFKWDKVSFLGHSYGSEVFFIYAGSYPDEIDTMINLDCASVRNIYKLENTIFDMRTTTEDIIKTTKYYEIKSYPFDECLQQISDNRLKMKFPLSDESYKVILKRGLINTGGKYTFSHDCSTKISTLGRKTYSLYKALSKNIKCNVLNISVAEGSGLHQGLLLEDVKTHTKTMEQTGKKIKHVIITGGHHVHLEKPDIVASIINEFLK